MQALDADKRIHLVPASMNGIYFLRLSICSEKTTSDDVKFASIVIKELTDKLDNTFWSVNERLYLIELYWGFGPTVLLCITFERTMFCLVSMVLQFIFKDFKVLVMFWEFPSIIFAF